MQHDGFVRFMSNLETFMKPSAIATQSFFSAYQNQNQKKKKVWALENSQVGAESRALPENKLQNGNIRNDFIHGSYSTHLLFFWTSFVATKRL